MANKWDALMKMLVRANPQAFVSFLAQQTSYQGDVTNELIIRSVEADFLCKAIQNNEDIIVHAEFQRRRDENMGRRMWEYNVATSFLTKLPVFSFALYIWKHGKIVKSPYILEKNGQLLHIFHYKNIFLWEEEPETLLQPGLEGLLPLLPLLKDAKKARNEIIDEMVEGLRSAGKDDILALGYAFAGLVYTKADDKQWLKRRFAMFHEILESSWSYQEMVQKGVDQGLEIGKRQGIEKGLQKGLEQGIEKGLQKGLEQGIEKGLQKGLEQGIQRGIEQGELQTLRSVLLRFVDKHFPALSSLARQQSVNIVHPGRLNAAVDQLLDAQTEELARQILMNIEQEEPSM